MPMRVEGTAAAGLSYLDIRAGAYHNIHQVKLDVSALTAHDDADGWLPPGLPILATGLPVSGAGQTAKWVIGPEAVKMGTEDVFANAFADGPLNQDAIEHNLGRVLSANELSALAAGDFVLI